MYDSPLVSVIITTFQRPEMLKRAILSVLIQNYSNIEIIVSDDNSNDDLTKEVVSKMSLNSRFPIIYRCNEINMGACYSRNEGIKISNGYFITGLDDDDEFTPNRISIFISKYSEKYSFITSNTRVIDKSNSYLLFGDESIVNEKNMLWYNCVGTQVFVRRDRILECGGFDLSLSSAQDADMWLRLIQCYGSALRLSEDLYLLHIEHDEPRISSSSNKIKGFMAFISKHKDRMSKGQYKFKMIQIMKMKNERKLNYYFQFIDIQVLFHLIKKYLKKY